MVEIGQVAPDFALTSDQGEMVRLTDFRGRKVVVYFYPKARVGGVRTAYALGRGPAIRHGTAYVFEPGSKS